MTASTFYGSAIGFAFGIFCATFYNFSFLSFGAVVLIGVVLLLYVHTVSATYKSIFVSCAVVVLGISCGIARVSIENLFLETHSLDQYIGKEITLEGTVVREPDERDSKILLTVDAEKIDDVSSEGLILVSTDGRSGVSYGDTITLRAKLTEPQSFEGDFGRTFDYSGFLSAQGVYYTMSFARVVSREPHKTILGKLYEAKHMLMASIEKAIPEPEAGLAEGLLLGVKRAIGKENENMFRIVGLIHIVVLSGYNLTIVAEAVMRLLSFFFSARTRLIIGMAVIALFALMVGLSSTVIRASVMAVLVLLARATGRTYDVTRALIFAGVVMLLMSPKVLVYDVGFQFSFLATLGLIYISPLVEEKFLLVPTRFQIREFLTATISAQIMVLPLLLYSMGILSLVAIPANLLVLPAIPFAMLVSFVAGVAGLISATFALPFAYISFLVLEYVFWICTALASIPYAAVTLDVFPFWVVCVSYLAITYIAYYMYHQIEIRNAQSKKILPSPPTTKIPPVKPEASLGGFPFK